MKKSKGATDTLGLRILLKNSDPNQEVPQRRRGMRSRCAASQNLSTTTTECKEAKRQAKRGRGKELPRRCNSNRKQQHRTCLVTKTCGLITTTSHSLAPCQARGVCSQHLRWDSVRKFRARLMKEGKPDEYTTEEAWNFQLTDSP
uniref:Uncharacterized protein n=1 Tax=Caenorhabditis japonica TaxID=281687 RepID=H2XDY3_CAEJA